jgi:hypothetical protein
MQYCWQCYTPYAGPAVPAGAAAASGSGRSAGVVSAGPLARPGASPAPSINATAPTSPSMAASSAPSWVGTAVKIGVVLVVAVAGFFAWRFFFGGFSFPEEINGQPRMEGEPAERLSDFMSGIGSLAGASIETAVYGQGPMPAYIMGRTEFEDAATLDLVVRSAPQLGGLRGGGLMCAPDAQGSSCVWLDGDTVILTLGGFVETPEALRPIAEDVRAEL